MRLFLKNLLFTLTVPGTFGVYIPLLLARNGTMEPPGVMAGAMILFVMATGLYLWSLRDFAVHGDGTPAPIDAPKRLVVRGPYRYLRNPMYVSALSAVAGWAVLFHSVAVMAYGLILGAVFHLFIVLYEEPHLRHVFGAEYERYCARVGRWLPRLNPRSGN